MSVTTLVVAEKPSVARDLAAVLGARTRHEGYFSGESYVVTWAIGHLVTLAEPGEMNPAWKKWRLEDLPLLPMAWPLVVAEGTRAQYEIVRRLLRSKTTRGVVCATDKSGNVDCWGPNDYGQVGDGKAIHEGPRLASIADSPQRDG